MYVCNSQSNPLDNLVELESVNIPCQEYVFLSVTTDKAEAVKNKQELLMEQLKEKEDEVKRLRMFGGSEEGTRRRNY